MIASKLTQADSLMVDARAMAIPGRRGLTVNFFYRAVDIDIRRSTY
jgi:hypothetical protein